MTFLLAHERPAMQYRSILSLVIPKLLPSRLRQQTQDKRMESRSLLRRRDLGERDGGTKRLALHLGYILQLRPFLVRMWGLVTPLPD